ncbi:MAG TPA: stage II sporulation protein M [Chloroflexota bacterium]|nr:stage II sporulation protein M [Chloroflexota bacterium]
MASLTTFIPVKQNSIRMALVIARREIRDSFRDWRIIMPIFLLTLAFPALMNFTARRAITFADQYGAEIIATQLIPFLLLVVGFFPMSFSLIIALETFVGEKERNSLEPLLASPLSNTELYAGKMLAALVPPLTASYLGMLVYMVSLWTNLDWRPEPELIVQVMLLTTVQGVIMVAAAVVVSSQATSVRAANLLASFIIVPMALLIQFEAGALFWGNHAGLWWLIVGLGLTAVVLIRMGLYVFNREELLGRDIDQIRLGWMFQVYWRRLSGQGWQGRYPRPLAWYKETFAIFPALLQPMGVLLLAFAGAVLFGIWLAYRYTLPPDMQAELTGANMVANLEEYAFLFAALPIVIILQNVRVIALQALLGVFTFGVLAVLIFMLPWGVMAFLAAQFYLAGQNPFQFLLAAFLPHALLEFPALLITTAAILRWQVVIIHPSPDHTLSENFLMRMADFTRIFLGVGLPLLIMAAFVEAHITTRVLQMIYG